MHEYSVVSSLIELCEEHALKNNAFKIEKIIVGIGERSGMDKSLFVSAFETFREESQVCKDAILDIVEEKVELECNDCHHCFVPEGIDYGVCPQCGSKNLEMIKGREMHLLSLEMIGQID
ncbi:hydrogenase/urease nickel incorporation protein HypA [Helicobacter sp. 11S02596-1]|uniref:hydrogenase/urease nickel incorporation protein HypA n=1 Tax=Helicobacter sp. 11S02596-1 TaxID=1476194 RepID=UPI000BA63BE3|nr:hydrogenase/urease nickel incorporation protein HypA [Helicobacter sp. 11S02596-1]PAF41529.1 hydrogenase maturation nickel metallochaperone HypA [Helicobacter sp. 11S02596-1]